MPKCSHCGQEVVEVIPLDIDLRARLKAADPELNLENEICRPCIGALKRKTLTSGGMLAAQARAKEENKVKLWKSRTGLVKQGHSQMASQLYSEAAISYEKYLRVLEMVFDCVPGTLSPKVLKEASKTTELTVIAGVYWDLVRVYDTSDQYGERQRLAAKQLAEFIPFTPIFPDILKKAATFQKHARHPEIIKSFLTTARKHGSRCFVASSAFNAQVAPEVIFLRSFRDQKMRLNPLGRKFIFLYYIFSPRMACFLDKHAYLKPFVRLTLRFVIKCVSLFL